MIFHFLPKTDTFRSPYVFADIGTLLYNKIKVEKMRCFYVIIKKQTLQRNAIMEQLYLKGSMSRAELARVLSITPTTMTEITAYLIK